MPTAGFLSGGGASAADLLRTSGAFPLPLGGAKNGGAGRRLGWMRRTAGGLYRRLELG